MKTSENIAFVKCTTISFQNFYPEIFLSKVRKKISIQYEISQERSKYTPYFLERPQRVSPLTISIVLCGNSGTSGTFWSLNISGFYNNTTQITLQISSIVPNISKTNVMLFLKYRKDINKQNLIKEVMGLSKTSHSIKKMRVVRLLNT